MEKYNIMKKQINDIIHNYINNNDKSKVPIDININILKGGDIDELKKMINEKGHIYKIDMGKIRIEKKN